jgi:hypothetical protein
MDLWEKLVPFVERGQETRKIDFKRQLDLSTARARAEFAKDVTAMANTGGGPGYLVIGVLDHKDRKGNNPADYVIGFRPTNMEGWQQQMVQALVAYCKPVPEVLYEEIIPPNVRVPIGVVVIPRSFKRPYQVGDNVFIRRGSHTDKVVPDEVGSNVRILLNFGRPLDEAQLEQAQTIIKANLDEVINIPGQLMDGHPYLPQIEQVVRQVGFTPEEWQSLPLVVNVHPFGPAASAVLAWLHGLRGYFPDILRIVRNEQTNHFDVVEVLSLQSIRNQIRSTAV